MLMTLAGGDGGGGGDEDNSTARGAVATQLCYLPNQLWTFKYCYAYLGAVTAALLLLPPLARGVLGHGARARLGMRKDKVEDDVYPDDHPDDCPGDDGEGVRVHYEYTGSGGGGGAGPLGSSAEAPKVFFAAGAGGAGAAAAAAAGRTAWRRAARVLWLGLPDIARHVIDTQFRPSLLELNDILNIYAVGAPVQVWGVALIIRGFRQTRVFLLSAATLAAAQCSGRRGQTF